MFLSRLLVPGRLYWTGLYGLESAWSWTSEGCVGFDKNWTNPTLEDSIDRGCRLKRPASGSCVAIAGRTGALRDTKCDREAYQCVCELHARESSLYRTTTQTVAQARQRSVERLRVWIAAIFTAAVVLPVAWDKRAVWSEGGREGPMQGDSRPGSLVHISVVHVGWAMMFFGFAPFVWQTVLGSWDSAQLGTWSRYSGLCPWGAMVLYENMRSQHIRVACVVRQQSPPNATRPHLLPRLGLPLPLSPALSPC